MGIYKEIGNLQDLLIFFGGFFYEEYLCVFFGWVDYKFLNCYFFGLSFWQDGFFKFNEDYCWGIFLVVFVGWVISDEFFWNNWIFSMVKLWGSFG